MMTLRESTVQDAALLSRIHAVCWKQAYRGLIPDHYLDRLQEDYWVPSVRAWLTGNRFSALIACEDDIPTGCIIFGRARDEVHADWGEIVSLYVLPEYARHGAGSLLLTESIRRLREEGYHDICLWCLDGARTAHAFYTKRGFCVSGVSPAYSIGGRTVRDLLYERRED